MEEFWPRLYNQKVGSETYSLRFSGVAAITFRLQVLFQRSKYRKGPEFDPRLDQALFFLNCAID